MKSSIKMVAVLTIIAALSGGLLSMWDGHTAPKIEKHRLDALVASIADVVPAHDFYEELVSEQVTLFVAKKKKTNEPVGIAFKAAGSGFQGKVSVMVGVTPDFKKLTGIKVLEQIETPGLGTKIVEDPSNKSNRFWFPNQFKGVEVQHEIRVIKNTRPTNKREVEAISGATITSVAVVKILNQSIGVARTVYQKMGGGNGKTE